MTANLQDAVGRRQRRPKPHPSKPRPAPSVSIARAVFLRQLSRAGAEVRRTGTGAGTKNVVVWGASGHPLNVPPGRLTTTQVRELLAALGIAWEEFQDMR